jgi:chromosome segregation protein
VAAASSRVEEMRKRQASAQIAHLEQQNGVARLHQEIAWRNGLLAEARQNIEQLSGQLAQIASQRDEVARLVAPQRAIVEESLLKLDDLQSERSTLAAGVGDGQTRLAVLAETLRNVQERENEALREAARIEARMRDLERRLNTTVDDETTLAKQLEEQSIDVTRLAEQLASIERQIGQSERQVRVLEDEVSRSEGEQSTLQAALLESETTHSRAAVEKQRSIGALDSLRVEITEEVGNGSESRRTVDDRRQTADDRLRWPLDGIDNGLDDTGSRKIVQATTLSPEQHAEHERRIYAMKARLSRLGPVNPLAMEEHAALAERHSYLQTQLRDLMSAAESLRRVIAELDRTMRDQFAATFERVNQAFQHFFHALFGGGTARLELTNPQDVSASGIEILAQPPGKRMQPLAALSGGERALTSAALLFALLRVRPVPFCVLDEVDAALDESNVTRFRSALQELGPKTQFIVITHNRGTIEAADTLYGISMAGDGTSQMLSLKVEAA